MCHGRGSVLLRRLANLIDLSNLPRILNRRQLEPIIALVDARSHQVADHCSKRLSVMTTISADSRCSPTTPRAVHARVATSRGHRSPHRPKVGTGRHRGRRT